MSTNDTLVEQQNLVGNETVCSWFCAQQGAREHYAIPRALASLGQLRQLITDVWMPHNSWLRYVPLLSARGLAGRSHQGLDREQVKAFNRVFLPMDVARKLIPQPDERFYTARNEKFDRLACAELERELPKRNTCEPWIVFSYAHSCRKLFHLAKEAGIRTVLGQFDPGPLQADIADREHAAHPQFRTSWKRYSDSYVQAWWDEVRLADNVLVNSTHSKDCLVRVGVPVEKIATIPLVYLPPATHNPERNYPRTFNRDRPLRVLFLGQVILLKGIARLIDAAKLLKDEAIDVRIVGPTNIDNLGDLCRGLPVNYVGSVPRDEVSREYQNADVFILPTLSDGFAITQLEALAWRLPVVTTTYCGEVVKNQVNGIALSEPTAENIANTLRQFLETPQRLAEMSRQARPEDFGIDRLAAQLETLANRWTK